MSHKYAVLQQITAQVANLLDQDEIDNLRIEVMSQGKRTVIVSDSTMLSVGEIAMLTGNTAKPSLRLVR